MILDKKTNLMLLGFDWEYMDVFGIGWEYHLLDTIRNPQKPWFHDRVTPEKLKDFCENIP